MKLAPYTRGFTARRLNRSRKLAQRKGREGNGTVVLLRRVTAGFLPRRNGRLSRGWACNLAILYRPAAAERELLAAVTGQLSESN